MPIALTSLLLHVGADTRDAEEGLGRVNQHMGRMGGLVGGVAATFTGGMAAVAGGVLAAVGTVKSFTDAAAESATESTRLNSVLASTKGVAGLSREELEKLADKLSYLSGMDDETVTSAESMLLTFTKIHKEVFPAAAEAALNLGSRFGSVQAASVQIGKALQDPIKGVTALQRVGVVLSEQQKQQIKDFVASGNVMAAQKVILGELNTEFGGLARNMGQTLPGALGTFHTQLRNMREAIGLALTEPIRVLLIQYVNPFLHAIAQELPGALDALGHRLGTIKEAFKQFAQAFAPVDDRVKNVSKTIRDFAKQVTYEVDAVVVFISNNLPKLGQTIKQELVFLQPLAQIGQTVADTFKPFVTDILPGLTQGFGGWGVTLPQISGALNDLVNGALSKFNDLWVTLGPALAQSLPILVQMGQTAGQMIQALAPLAGVLSPIGDLLKDLAPALAPLIPILLAVAAQIQSALLRNIQLVIPPILQLVKVLVDGLHPVFLTIIDVVKFLAPVIGNLLATALDTLGPIIAEIVTLLAQHLAPILKDLAPILSAVIKQVGLWVSQILTDLMPLIQALGQLLMKVLPPAFDFIGQQLHYLLDIFKAVWPVIQTIVDVALTNIRNIIHIVTDIISGNWSQLGKDLIKFGQDAWDGVIRLVRTALGALWNIILAVTAPLRDAILKPFNMAKDAVSDIWKGLGNFTIDAINNFVIAGINGLVAKTAQAVDWITDKLHAGKPLQAAEKGGIIGNLPRFARGGVQQRTGWALVGEEGPELAYLTAGSRVWSNSESMSGYHGGGPTGGADDNGPFGGFNPLQGIQTLLGNVDNWFVKGAVWLRDNAFKMFGVPIPGNIPPFGDITGVVSDAVKAFIDSNLLGGGGDISGALKSAGAHWWLAHITQGFHDPRNPAHGGIDFGIGFHTPLAALLGGIVSRAGYFPWGGELDLWTNLPGYGRGLENYTHLDFINPAYMRAGASVPSGAVVGLSGGQNAGGLHPALRQFSSGPHFHYNWFAHAPWAHDDLNPTPFIASLRGGVIQHRGYANGGWVTEPVVGYGLGTGAMYTFAENRPEYVSPGGGLGSANYHFHAGSVVIQGSNKSAAQLFDEIKAEADWRGRGHG